MVYVHILFAQLFYNLIKMVYLLFDHILNNCEN